MATRPSGPERADKLLCWIAREFMLRTGGHVFEGNNSDFLESDHPRVRGAIQFAQVVMRKTNPRLFAMSADV